VPSGDVTVVVVVVVTEWSLLVTEVVLVVVFVPSAAVVVVAGVETVPVDVELAGLVPEPMHIGMPLESTPACTVPPGHLPPVWEAGTVVVPGVAFSGVVITPASPGASFGESSPVDVAV
jgi:hypothetical protein